MNDLLLFVLLDCGTGILAGTPLCHRHQHVGRAVGRRTCPPIDQNHRLISLDLLGCCQGVDFDGVNATSNAVHFVENAWRYADERI